MKKIGIWLFTVVLCLEKVLQLQQQYCTFSSRTAAAAVVLQLQQQQQHLFKISNNHCRPILVVLDKSLSKRFNLLFLSAFSLEKVLQLQPQYCSCNYTSTLLDKFRMSKYLYVSSLVMINTLQHKLFNILTILISYLKKMLQLQLQ